MTHRLLKTAAKLPTSILADFRRESGAECTNALRTRLNAFMLVGMKAHKKQLPETDCLMCSVRFQPTRHWQRFCSPGCRVQAFRAGDDLFAEHTCVYCGMIATDVDHVPPRSVRPTLIELGRANEFPFLEVHACHECNLALGNKALWTVCVRKAYCKRWIERRNKRQLAMPDWSAAELSSMSPKMQEQIQHGLAVRDVTRLRLRW